MHMQLNRFGALMLALAGLLALAGCPEEDPAAQLAQQYASQGGGAPVEPPADDPSGQGGAVPEGFDASSAGGIQLKMHTGSMEQQTNTPPPAQDPGQHVPGGTPSGDESVITPPEGPDIGVTVVNIDPPGPRYTGKGRYDLTLEVTADPPVDEGVFKIIALNDKDEVVGEQEQMLLLLHQRPKTFEFAGFYCSAMPTDVVIELAYDDKGQPKQAVKASPGSSSQGGGGGAAGGGATGGGGGAAGGGAAGGGGGSGSGGDEGGGDLGLDD